MSESIKHRPLLSMDTAGFVRHFKIVWFFVTSTSPLRFQFFCWRIKSLTNNFSVFHDYTTTFWSLASGLFCYFCSEKKVLFVVFSFNFWESFHSGFCWNVKVLCWQIFPYPLFIKRGNTPLTKVVSTGELR